MKKSKFLVLGIIAVMLVSGLVLASCGEKCSMNGNCVYRSDEDFYPLQAVDCSNSSCAVTKITEPRQNANVKCDC